MQRINKNEVTKRLKHQRLFLSTGALHLM